MLMRTKGYEIKGETFGEDTRKYISFRPMHQKNFVRGSARSLGKEYTKERIKERIEQKWERKVVIPKKIILHENWLILLMRNLKIVPD